MSNKLILVDSSLVDILVVSKALPKDEIEQILAFGGAPDPERIAMTIMQSATWKWSLVVEETGEPLAVGGYVQTGPTIYRSFFLANPRLWDEFGADATEIVADTLGKIKEQFENVRLETYCLSTRRREVPEWYEKIGLTYDCTLQGFGVNGEDALLYSTVKKAGAIKLATVADAAAEGIKV